MKKLNPNVPGFQGNFSFNSECKNGRIEDTRPALPGFEREELRQLTVEEQELEDEKERRRKAWKELKEQEEQVKKDFEKKRQAWLNLTQGKGTL